MPRSMPALYPNLNVELTEEINRKEDTILRYIDDVAKMKKKFKYVRDSKRGDKKDHTKLLTDHKDLRWLMCKSVEIHREALQTCEASTQERILKFFSKPSIKALIEEKK